MTLTITGPVVRKAQYDRLPMRDALGPVSAFIRPTYVEYRPKGGTFEERHARAKIIAAEIGGTVAVSADGSYHVAWIPFGVTP